MTFIRHYHSSSTSILQTNRHGTFMVGWAEDEKTATIAAEFLECSVGFGFITCQFDEVNNEWNMAITKSDTTYFFMITSQAVASTWVDLTYTHKLTEKYKAHETTRVIEPEMN